MESLKEELHSMQFQMPELERKLLNLEAEKDMLTKVNVEMKYALRLRLLDV